MNPFDWFCIGYPGGNVFMELYFITFRSVTLAQRGEKALMEGGQRATLARTPRWMEEKGCGYCLRLRCEDVGRWAAILRQRGIPFRRIYRQRGDGEMGEVVL